MGPVDFGTPIKLMLWAITLLVLLVVALSLIIIFGKD